MLNSKTHVAQFNHLIQQDLILDSGTQVTVIGNWIKNNDQPIHEPVTLNSSGINAAKWVLPRLGMSYLAEIDLVITFKSTVTECQNYDSHYRLSFDQWGSLKRFNDIFYSEPNKHYQVARDVLGNLVTQKIGHYVIMLTLEYHALV